MERYSQLLPAQKCINIRYSVHLLLNKFIPSHYCFSMNESSILFIKRNWFISHFECSLWMKCGWKQCFLFAHAWIIPYVHPKWKIFFFFCKSFWFWSLEMQMKTIFTLYMNHSWFEAWRLNSSNQSITFVIRCFIQSLFLSLKYVSKKLSSHPSCSLSFSSYPSSYPTTILSLFFIISFTINLAPKIVSLKLPVCSPNESTCTGNGQFFGRKYTRARNKSVGKAFRERARVVGDVNATKNT